MTPTRPALRYHGSKWRIAPWIISHFPAHLTYVEPFGGGASVLLRKPAAVNEVYNDMDGEIVNVFRVLRGADTSHTLARLLDLTPHARAEYDLAFDPADCPVEQARRTIIKAYMGHGSAGATGQYKTGFRNRRSGDSGPANEWATYPASVATFHGRFRAVTLECLPAVDVIQRYDSPTTLFYVDPPYVMNTRTSNSKAYRFEMTDADHEGLADALHGVKGLVVLSGYECPLYSRLYAGWHMTGKVTSCNGNTKGQSRIERLWLSPRTEQALSNRLPMGVGV